MDNITKKTIIRDGDVFCVEFKNNTKCYFQNICKDIKMLNSNVIKVFKTHYPVEADIKIEDIVKDEVDFYAHTLIRVGIISNAWYKIAKNPNGHNYTNNDVTFGYTLPCRFDWNNLINIPLEPNQYWRIWKLNSDLYEFDIFPSHILDVIEFGAVIPFHQVITRMQLGYYTSTLQEYSLLKRVPHDHVFSYIKFNYDNNEFYLCYHGNDFEKGVIPIDGKSHKITKDDAISKTLEITNKKFSDTNWKNQDFITKEEFNTAWDSIK